jgi:hypothetical protein
MRSEHLDYLPLHEGGPMRDYCATRPPCNTGLEIALAVSAVASLAGAGMSYASAQTAAKQAELNASAQNKAIAQEQQRQAQQEQENQRRAATEQARFRAQQQAAMASSGAMMGTGSSLSLEADTWAKQQIELSDQQYMADLSQRQLAYEGQSIMDMGRQQSAAIKSQAAGQLVSSVAGTAMNAYSGFTTKPTTVK